MPLLSKPAFGPRTAIIYITIGSLIDVWTAVYYFSFARGDMSRNTWFWLIGLFLTGLTLIVIGVLLGEIGRSARKAELPPPEVQNQEAAIQQTAAAVPQMMPGTMAGAPMMTAPMMGAMPAAAPVQPAMPAQPSPMVPGSRR
jgi:hypothetical protein